jgi:hypothetical protein
LFAIINRPSKSLINDASSTGSHQIRDAAGRNAVNPVLTDRFQWFCKACQNATGKLGSRSALVSRYISVLIAQELKGIVWLEGRRFDNCRHVVLYAGRAPTPWKSSSIDHEQGVSKAGNSRLTKGPSGNNRILRLADAGFSEQVKYHILW